eukprot:2332194-Amphidinium_carterae.1
MPPPRHWLLEQGKYIDLQYFLVEPAVFRRALMFSLAWMRYCTDCRPSLCRLLSLASLRT